MPSQPHPFLNEIVGARHSAGAYAILEIRLPAGFLIPRHVHRGHLAHLNVVQGALEVSCDGEPPAIICRGTVTVTEGRPVSGRVLEDVRMLVVLAPAGQASLLPAAASPGVLPDDRAALLAAAGISLLPRRLATGDPAV